MCAWGKKGEAWEQDINVFCSSYMYSTIYVHYSKSYLDIGKVQLTNTKREAEPVKE